MRRQVNSGIPGIVLLAFAFVFANCSFAQIDTPRIAPRTDTRDLYARVMASDFVIIGKVVGGTVVRERVPEGDLERMVARMNHPPVGERSTVQIEQVICEKGETRSQSKIGQRIEMFVPNEPFYVGDLHREEILVDNHEYLFFLVAPPPKEQALWTSSFDLEPNRTYYRGEQMSRGVVHLRPPFPMEPTSEAPVVEKVKRLCEALGAPTMKEKLSRLDRLIESDDPVLQTEARIAKLDLDRGVPQK